MHHVGSRVALIGAPQAAVAGLRPLDYSRYAAEQIGYMLGDNPASFSYLVGYGTHFPRQPHHKVFFIFFSHPPGLQAAACASPPARCTWATFSDTSRANPHLLAGALVGGPKAADDAYTDLRTDFVSNEVSLDYNAGFTSAVAGLLQLQLQGRDGQSKT